MKKTIYILKEGKAMRKKALPIEPIWWRGAIEAYKYAQYMMYTERTARLEQDPKNFYGADTAYTEGEEALDECCEYLSMAVCGVPRVSHRMIDKLYHKLVARVQGGVSA